VCTVRTFDAPYVQHNYGLAKRGHKRLEITRGVDIKIDVKKMRACGITFVCHHRWSWTHRSMPPIRGPNHARPWKVTGQSAPGAVQFPQTPSFALCRCLATVRGLMSGAKMLTSQTPVNEVAKMNGGRNVGRVVLGTALLALALGFAGEASVLKMPLGYAVLSTVLVAIGCAAGATLVYAGIKFLVRTRGGARSFR
jgi:hypothetical protein